MTATDHSKKSAPGLGMNRDAPLAGDLNDVLALRSIRRQVKHTASLVSTQGHVKEMPGPSWMADIRDRTIFWRGDSMFSKGIITKDELLFLVTHEASHLNYTGGWELSKDIDPAKFHRFLNGLEDVRIERLSEKEFGGFGRLRRKINPRAMELHRAGAEGYHMLDQVWLNWFALEYGQKPLASIEAQEFAKRTWDRVTRMCNARSTQDLAEMLEPIYRELVKDDPPGKGDGGQDSSSSAGGGGQSSQGGNSQPDADSLPQELDSKGNDEPVDDPERSPLPPEDKSSNRNGPGDQSLADMLEQMLGDAFSPEAKAQLKRMIEREMHAQRQGEQAQQMLCGQNAGTDSPPVCREGDAAWEKAAHDMRPQINTLERKLTAVLRHNALDEWEPGLKRGQLDAAVAYRSLAGHMNIFRDRHALGEHEYAFAITVDMSSSQGPRAKQLLNAAVLSCEAIDRAGLGLLVIPWNTRLQTVKPFTRGLKPYKGVLGRAIGMPAGGTYEAPALVLAQEALSRINRGVRVLITLTDGQTSNIEASKTVIAELEDSGVITIGIGIAFEAPQHYERKYNVDRADELALLLPKIISENVRRG